MRKKRILVCCDYYLPGFKSGGGMLTVANLVERFGDGYDFFVFTRNHDGPNDRTPYSGVKTGQWNRQAKATVFYASPAKIGPRIIADIVAESQPDAVFLNSAFSKPVRSFLEARRKKLIAEIPAILAPCGELSAGALSLKPLKKKLFLLYARTVGLYDGVIWKGSFEAERKEIYDQIGRDVEVMIAPDLAPRTILPNFDPARKPSKRRGSARFAFLSRISRKKNVHFLLELLRAINDGEIYLDLIGPIEDDRYWQQCEAIIRELPENVHVTPAGGLHQSEALDRLRQSHFFVLPTLHENFGYVFIEALAAGCPILVSENTAWGEVEEKRIGWVMPLESPEAWVERLRGCIEMGTDEYEQMSAKARAFAVEWLGRPEHEEATAAVLERALGLRANAAENGI